MAQGLGSFHPECLRPLFTPLQVVPGTSPCSEQQVEMEKQHLPPLEGHTHY